MNTQEMLNAKQAYEQPWTESIRLQVEKIICGSGTGEGFDNEDDNQG